MKTDQQEMDNLRSLCKRLMADDGDLTQAEIDDALAAISGPRSATYVLSAARKRFFKPLPQRRVRRGHWILLNPAENKPS